MKITPTLRAILVAMCLCMVFSLFACTEEVTTLTDSPATDAPTEESTEEKTEAPTSEKTEAPTQEKTEAPTDEPTETEEPTESPCAHEEVVLEGKAATCTETGLTEGKKCSKCEEILVPQEEIPATGHTEVTLDAVAPTCTATGLTEGKKCSVCDAVLTAQEEVAALGHTEETLAAVAPTCQTTGLTEGKKCSVCNEILVAQTEVAIDPNAHNMDNGTPAEAAKCGDKATVTYKCQNEGCTHTTVVEGEVLAHDMDEGTVTTAPTCTEKGVKTFSCKREGCTHTTTEEVAALGHDMDTEGSVTTAPTCTEKGVKTFTCKRNCGHKTTEEIAELGHKEETVAGKAATCTATGLTEGKKCSVCGVTTVEQNEIPVVAHTEELVAGKDATCTATGLTEGKKCSVCGTVTKAQETVDALGHAKKDVAYVASTTAELGCAAHKACERCDAVWTTADETTTLEALAIAKLVPETNYYFGFEELKNKKANSWASPDATETVPAADRTYVRFQRTKLGTDNSVYFLDLPEIPTTVSGQYLVVKYRTNEPSIGGFTKTTTGALDGNDAFSITTKGDEAWHITILDLSKANPKTFTAAADGKFYTRVLRLDILDVEAASGYFDIAFAALTDDLSKVTSVLSEGDTALCPHMVGANATYTDKGENHTTNCSVCAKELAYDHSLAGVPTWDAAAKLYKGSCACGKEMTSEAMHITEARAANDQANGFTISQQDGFVRYTVKEAKNNDHYFYPIMGGSAVTGNYMIIKYRLVNNGKEATGRTFFIGSTMSSNGGATGSNGDGSGNKGWGNFIGDGEWHYYIISVDPGANKQFIANTDGTYSFKYARIGFNPAATDGSCYMDIDYLAFVDNLNAAENFAFTKEPTPVHKVNFDQSNCKITGTEGSILEKSLQGTHIAVDMTGKTLTSPTSLYLGGWCVTPGGCKTYKINVIKIDGAALVEKDMFDWITPGDCAVDNGITKVGTGAGWSTDCRLGATTGGSKPVDLSAYAGHTIDFEIVVETNFGQSFTWATFTNVVVPAAQ